MVSLSEARDAPARQLWDEINSVHAGMLGLEGLHNHMQPMAPHADPKTNTIWFFTKKSADLVQTLKSGARAHFASSARITIITPASPASWKFAKTKRNWMNIGTRSPPPGTNTARVTQISQCSPCMSMMPRSGHPLTAR